MAAPPLPGQHPGYMTADEVVRIFKVTRATVYWRASKHRWRRYTLDGKTRYHRADVNDTLGKPA